MSRLGAELIRTSIMATCQQALSDSMLASLALTFTTRRAFDTPGTCVLESLSSCGKTPQHQKHITALAPICMSQAQNLSVNSCGLYSCFA